MFEPVKSHTHDKMIAAKTEQNVETITAGTYYEKNEKKETFRVMTVKFICSHTVTHIHIQLNRIYINEKKIKTKQK